MNCLRPRRFLLAVRRLEMPGSGVANVPREWEAHQRRREMVMERLTMHSAQPVVSSCQGSA